MSEPRTRAVRDVMQRNFASRHFLRLRLTASLVVSVVSLLTSGFTSCAGTTGPLFAPLTITPREVLLRASLGARQEAVGLARVDGGEGGDQYSVSIDYGRDATAQWLNVEASGRDLTLRANPGGLDPGVYLATVTVEGQGSGASGLLRVEFTVIP